MTSFQATQATPGTTSATIPENTAKGLTTLSTGAAAGIGTGGLVIKAILILLDALNIMRHKHKQHENGAQRLLEIIDISGPTVRWWLCAVSTVTLESWSARHGSGKSHNSITEATGGHIQTNRTISYLLLCFVRH